MKRNGYYQTVHWIMKKKSLKETIDNHKAELEKQRHDLLIND